MAKVGPVVSKAFTYAGAAAGAGLVIATGAAVELQDQMANVATVVPTADIAGLTDEVQELSRSSGVSTTDLTSGLYDLVSAGVSAEDAIGVLSASTNLAIGGLGTTAGAADVVTSAMNAYGMAAGDAGKITDVFALAIQKGKVTADEIGSSIANIAPIAASAGIPLEEVSAAYAQLTAKGVPAAQATTQMRAAISALLTPNEALNRIQAATGKNFADIAAEKGLAVALEELRVATADSGSEFGNFQTAIATWQNRVADGSADVGDLDDLVGDFRNNLGLTNDEAKDFLSDVKTEGMGEALANLQRELGASDAGFAGALGSIDALQFSLSTTGDEADSFQGQITDMYAATGTAAEQAAIKMDSPAEAGKRLFATFQTFIQDVGGPFASSLGPIVFAMNQMGPAMGGLLRPATAAGGAIGALAGKIVTKLGPAISGMGGKLLPKFGTAVAGALTGIVPALGGAVTSVVSGLGGLFAAAMPLLAAALPFLIAAAVIAGIVLLIVNPEIRDAVFGFIGGVIGWIGDALGALAGFVGNIFGTAFSAIGDVIGGVVDAILAPVFFIVESIIGIFTGGLEAVSGVVSGGLGIIGTIIGTAVGVIGTIFSTAFELWIGAWTFIFETIGGIIGGAFEIISAVIGGAIAVIGGIFSGARDTFVAIWDAIAGGIGAAVGVITAVIGGITGVVGGVADAISGFFGWITGQTNEAKAEIASVNSATPTGQFSPANMGGVPQLQSGAWETTGGLAFLHAGEMVLPPDLAASFRTFLSGSVGPGGGGAAGGGGGGDIYYITVQQEIEVPIAGLLRAERPKDVVEELARAANLGYFDVGDLPVGAATGAG